MDVNATQNLSFSSSSVDPRKKSPLRKWIFRAGCGLAGTTIIIASLGGHKYEWSAHKKYLFNLGINYSFFNALGMIISSLVTESPLPAALFLGATLGFSTPIWYKCFTERATLSALLPFGGIAMIAAWIALAIL